LRMTYNPPLWNRFQTGWAARLRPDARKIKLCVS
jgi:hypothetical protein